MLKVKEKLDKCHREKLLEFCDVFDITLSSKSTKVSWFSSLALVLVVDETLIH